MSYFIPDPRWEQPLLAPNEKPRWPVESNPDHFLYKNIIGIWGVNGFSNSANFGGVIENQGGVSFEKTDFLFDGGSTTWLKIPDADDTYNLDRNFSIFNVFRLDSGSTDRAMFSQNAYNGLYFRINSSNKLQLVASFIADILAGTTTLTVGQLYSSCITVGTGGTAPVTLYLDGIDDGSTTYGDTFVGDGETFRAIGADVESGTGSQTFAGIIPLTLYINKELNANEVSLLHRSYYDVVINV